MRFSKAVDSFHILPSAAKSYDRYRDTLISIAQSESATLLIPVSGAGSSVEDARAAETTFEATQGRCRTFIQDAETMLDLHEKDRFAALVEKLGLTVPKGQLVESVDAASKFLKSERTTQFVLKCLALDENRGDMTLFPLQGDDKELSNTRRLLQGLAVQITADCPYVFQEFIPGPGGCCRFPC
jgi:glutathione synthase/RimK-type ligase-like ATP-grasp enzyme